MATDTRKSRVEDSRYSETRDANIRRLLQMGYQDKLYIDPRTIPDGIEYRWIRDSLLGQPDLNRLAFMKRKGWTPVPSGRHPELMAEQVPWREDLLKGYLCVEGLVLCERPKEYGDIERRAMEERNIRDTGTIPGQDHFMDDPSMPMRVLVNQTSIQQMQRDRKFADN